MTTDAIRVARTATINRAIELIDTADPAELMGWLDQTSLHLKDDPEGLRDRLDAATYSGGYAATRFGAWKAAQQLLLAAGLPYMPADYAP